MSMTCRRVQEAVCPWIDEHDMQEAVCGGLMSMT